MDVPDFFKRMINNKEYSEKTIEEIWKWYDYSKKKGVASF